MKSERERKREGVVRRALECGMRMMKGYVKIVFHKRGFERITCLIIYVCCGGGSGDDEDDVDNPSFMYIL